MPLQPGHAVGETLTMGSHGVFLSRSRASPASDDDIAASWLKQGDSMFGGGG